MTVCNIGSPVKGSALTLQGTRRGMGEAASGAGYPSPQRKNKKRPPYEHGAK